MHKTFRLLWQPVFGSLLHTPVLLMSPQGTVSIELPKHPDNHWFDIFLLQEAPLMGGMGPGMWKQQAYAWWHSFNNQVSHHQSGH